MKDIGVLLKEKRKENGVSIAEVAEDLEVDETAIENMEEGNVRAFKDMYTLKELVKDYAKYLGMDVNDILEEFNDFLFEHTSKISLDDIRETKAKLQDTTSQKKIASPYTIIPKPKRDYKKILLPILIVCLIILIIMLLISSFSKSPKRRVELKNVDLEGIYEFA